MARASDSQSQGHKFNSQPTIGKLFTRAFVAKQYNSILAKELWCISTEKVTVGLAESNASLPPGLWLSHLCFDDTETWISFSNNAHTEYGTTFTLLTRRLEGPQQGTYLHQCQQSPKICYHLNYFHWHSVYGTSIKCIWSTRNVL